ncbi:MAG: MFS transporter [Proteobacteria bacterium]|nr:MFS transporter [Pseudomonadota bacterium]
MRTDAPRASAFFAVWLAQTCSLLGTSATGFALGVYFFQRTGSTTVYGLIGLVTLAPQIACTPLAGVLSDCWPRRRALMAGHAGAGLCTAVLCGLYLAGGFSLPAVLALVAAASTTNAIHYPAFSALTTQLVPESQRGRANGFVQLGVAAQAVVAPPLGAWLLSDMGLAAVLVFDVLTFASALVFLGVVRIAPAEGEAAPVRSVRRELRFAVDFLRARPGLWSLVVFFFAVNFLFGTAQLVLTPLVLGIGTVTDLGRVLAWGGAGMVAGGLAMLAWGGPVKKIPAIAGFTAVQGLMFGCAVATPSIALVSAAVFGAAAMLPMTLTCSQTLWQRYVPLAAQGRVFALRATVAQLGVPLAMLTMGPVVESVLEPLLLPGGPLAASLGPYVGVGPGRGTALLIALAGGCTVGLAVALACHRQARALDEPAFAEPPVGAGVAKGQASAENAFMAQGDAA